MKSITKVIFYKFFFFFCWKFCLEIYWTKWVRRNKKQETHAHKFKERKKYERIYIEKSPYTKNMIYLFFYFLFLKHTKIAVAHRTEWLIVFVFLPFFSSLPTVFFLSFCFSSENQNLLFRNSNKNRIQPIYI